MKIKMEQVKELIRRIVNETINLMQEEHQRGEWWIDDYGTTTYCDNTVVDQGHEYVVVGNLIHEILSHFGIDEDEPQELQAYEDTIKQNLLHKGRLSDEEIEDWNNGPFDIILKKIIEDKAYKTPEQAEESLLLAYGSRLQGRKTKDARDYAMKYWKWKIMKSDGGVIHIQTWHLKPDDLNAIVRGIWEIMGEDTDDPEDPDNKLGPDGYPGPRVNVTVEKSGKQFNDVPLAVLEKKVPSSLMNYRSGQPWELMGVDTTKREGIEESFHHVHKEYRLYEGNRHIIASFNDGSRLKFEVHFRNNHGEDREKWRHKAFTKWKSLASKIHGNEELTEVGNPVERSWKECFKEALKDPEMKEYIRTKKHQAVFDPVNFTQMG